MLNKILLPSVIVLLLLKIIALNFTTFNLFGDEAQYWLWSKNIDFGYFSKPPFLSWIIRVYTEILGSSFVSLKLLPSFVYLLIAWSIYNLLLNSGLNKKDSLAGSLIFLFIPAVSFSSFIISTDLFLLLFWTLSLNELIKINSQQGLKNFILLGIFLGLAFLSKYAAIYFVICLFVLILLDRRFRKIFFDNLSGFSLTFLSAFIIIVPNIIWNFNNDWVTLQHTSDNANFANIEIDFIRGLEFLSIQVLMLGPFMLLGGLFRFNKWRYIQKIFLIFSIPIILIVLAEAIIVRANANWAAPALISLFVFLYIRTNISFFKIANFIFNFTVCFVLFVMIGTSYPSKIFDRVTGINDYALKIYDNSSNSAKEIIVVSDRLLFSSLNFELRDRDINFYMPHKEGEKITNHFKIMSPLNKNINENFTLIGSPSDINYLENEYKMLKIGSPDQKFTKRKLDVYEVVFE
ncbi:glycosyltransferase family 39 protein [Pelagibacteraceae bacterium]|nr:glycosyltransferase family 39 protein [Pelagibacteraceae bacterium]